MKTKFLSLIASAFILCNTTLNAQSWHDMRWSDGNESIYAEQLAPSQVLFVASSHDDACYGYLFNVKKAGANTYDLIGTDKALSVPKAEDGIERAIILNHNYNGAGLNWKRQQIHGMDLILRYNQKKLTSIFQETSENLREIAQYKIMEVIEGEYTSLGDGKTYKFLNDGTCIFADRKTSYKIEDKFEQPDFIISVDNKKYVLNIDSDGMLIYEAVTEGLGDDVAMGKFIAALKYNRNTYRWPSTSAYPASSYVLELLDKDVLRLMRNEIYARHGWRFKDAVLNNYFREFKWYKPEVSNDKIKLTEMELLNVSLLNYYENK